MKRLQKLAEFIELRSGKDLAYHFRREIKFRNFGGDASHLINRSFRDNYLLTASDYDLKVYAALLVTVLLIWCWNILKK